MINFAITSAWTLNRAEALFRRIEIIYRCAFGGYRRITALTFHRRWQSLVLVQGN